MESRIETAIQQKETWTYQFGNFPVYSGGNTIRDSVDSDNDLIKLSFHPSATDGFNLTIIVGFDAVDGEEIEEAGGIVLDINTVTGGCLLTHPCECPHPPYSDLMDVGSVIQALAVFDLCAKLEVEHAEELKKTQEALEARALRKSYFRVVQ
ncbi:hypothetical protein D3C80_1469090 [compost metagenome]